MSAPVDDVVMRPPIKVVFLDIDGVLVNRESLRTAGGFRSKGSSDCVAALNRITDETGAVIVVSSTWRRKGRGFVLRTLRGWGVTGRMIGITPVLNAVDRGEEIQAWLDDYQSRRGEVDAFVILDDDNDMLHLAGKLVQTDFMPGLTVADADQAIMFLSQ